MLDWGTMREDVARNAPVPDWVEGALSDMWIAPPFSILNTNLAAWRERKRYWLSMGIQSELGRPLGAEGNDEDYASTVVATGEAGVSRPRTTMAHITAGTAPEIAARFEAAGYSTSIFDPVLCELVYRWWAPPGGAILDPFAGGSVRGVVAGYLGHPYTAIDLSERQLASNREQARVILDRANTPQPVYYQGDSGAILPTLADRFDLIMTCPPYFDLEVYGDDPADLSRAPSFAAFEMQYRAIIKSAVALLRPNRFAVFVVGEVRDKRDANGGYVGLVPATIEAFRIAGLTYYNEVILVNAVGSLPLRTGRQFEATRKVGKMHQNILVFLKGDVPRGWDAKREDPPDPQQSMFDL